MPKARKVGRRAFRVESVRTGTKTRKIGTLCLAAIFLIKLIVLLQLRQHPLLQHDAGLDTTVYVDLARQVAAGNLTLGPGVYFVSPLYIYVVALIVKLTSGSLFWVRLVQITAGTASVWLVFKTAEMWYGRRTGWIAGSLAAFTGLFTFYEILLLQAAIDPILTSAALAALAAALTRDRPEWYGASGIAIGIHALNRPNVLIAGAGVVLMLCSCRRWRRASLVAAGVLAALLPVTARNLIVSGDLSPLSSHGGLNFYIGNNAEANGTYHMVEGITPSMAGQQTDARRVAETAMGRPLEDSDVSAYFYQRGWAWIRSEPLAAARLFALKLAYTLNATELPLNYSYAYYRRDESTLLAYLPVGSWLLIPLGLIGFWLAAPPDPVRRRQFWIWASFVPFYALSVAVFFVSSRYRLPLLIAFCVTAAGTIDTLIRLTAEAAGGDAAHVPARRMPAKQQLIVAVPAILALAVLANWNFGLDDGRQEERLRMALTLIEQEQYGDAGAQLDDLAREYPVPGILHFRVGRAFLAKGQSAAAVRHLELATKHNPDRPENDYALGQALVDAGRPAEAIPHLRRALDAGVRADVAGYDLARAYAGTGDRARALAALQDVRPALASDSESWFVLGQLAMELDAPQIAARFFQTSLQGRPDNVGARHQLGLAFARMGRFDQAVGELERAIGLEPNDAALRLNLAVSLAELGRTEEARAAAEYALRLRPSYQRAREFLAALK